MTCCCDRSDKTYSSHCGGQSWCVRIYQRLTR